MSNVRPGYSKAEVDSDGDHLLGSATLSLKDARRSCVVLGRSCSECLVRKDLILASFVAQLTDTYSSVPKTSLTSSCLLA